MYKILHSVGIHQKRLGEALLISATAYIFMENKNKKVLINFGWKGIVSTDLTDGTHFAEAC